MKKFTILFSLLFAAGLFMVSPSFAPAQGMMNSHSFQVKELLGKTIKDKQGKSIGKVSDVVIGKDGRAAFVIISRGGLLGGGKYTPVPFKTFMSNVTNMAGLQKESDLKSNLAWAEINKAPTYSSPHWNMSSQRMKVCDYFGPAQCNQM